MKQNTASYKIKQYLMFGGVGTALFLCVVIVPFLYGLYLTLTSWDGVSLTKPFVGLANFIAAFQEELKRLYPAGTETSDYFVHIVKESAFDRLQGYLKDGRVVAGGHYDRARLWMEPTLLEDVSPEAPVMQEEIFGPIFPILTFRAREEVAAFVNGREKPLAFYYFGPSPAAWKIIGRTTSGGACINDTIMHIANSHLPFGGVGNSGMGSYHSERSFLAFSHERAVVKASSCIDLPFRYMPYKFFGLIKKLL